jgi:hypothetical protein
MALGFQGVCIGRAKEELGRVSGRVQFSDWHLNTLGKFIGPIPIASNALKMFFGVYAAALAHMTTPLENLLTK